MNLIDELSAWLSDPTHWSGPDGMVTRTLEHLALSGFCVALAVLIALPIGLYIGHTGRIDRRCPTGTGRCQRLG